MNTLSSQGRSVRTVLVILLIAILLDKFLISPLVPAVAGLAGIDPMLVILDIPLGFPTPCGLLPVTSLFILLYYILIIPYHSKDRHAWTAAKARLRAVTTGVAAVPCCVISSGLIWMAFEDRFPRQIRNAIGSFGINADLYSTVPGYERIRLHGSMVMLAGFFIGLYIFSRKMRSAARILASEAMRSAAAAAAAEALSPARPRREAIRPAGPAVKASEAIGSMAEETMKPAPENMRTAAATRIPSARVSVILPTPRNVLINSDRT